MVHVGGVVRSIRLCELRHMDLDARDGVAMVMVLVDPSAKRLIIVVVDDDV